MAQRWGWKGLISGLTALVFALGAGLPAAAEGWPEETVSDTAGNTYKQVKTPDGGVQVWQFIGIFGDPGEALELVGLSEDGAKKGTETIGEIPYEYSLKKPEEGGAQEEDGLTLRWSLGGRKTKLSRKPAAARRQETGAEKEDPAGTGATENAGTKKAGRRRAWRLRGVIPVDQIDWSFNQIFIQENRASGR